MKLLPQLLAFMKERHAIYLRRAAGQPKPWTNDELLRKYRFCNVYRELDTVTVWIREHIREPYADHPDLWFLLAAARQINWPDTLDELLKSGTMVPKRGKWTPEPMRQVMLTRQSRGDKLYTGAYMLNAHGRGPEDPSDKAFFTTHLVLGSVWKNRHTMEAAFERNTLEAAHAAFLPHHGWGSFTAAQVIADMKYTKKLKYAADWLTWAAPGPGSLRGLNVVLGRDPAERWVTRAWLETLQLLRDEVNGKWPHELLHAQDMQNCLCEFYKYRRGFSRTHYQGA